MKPILSVAAELLEIEAKCLKDGHTINGEWPESEADTKEAYTELVVLAESLRQLTPIKWIDVTHALPDADTTVMISNPLWDEPVGMGWLDSDLLGHLWRSIDAEPLDGQEGRAVAPTHWADLPEGPEVSQ